MKIDYLTTDYKTLNSYLTTSGSGRLEKELHELLSPSLSCGVKVVPPPYGADTAWFGAKLIGNVSCISLLANIFASKEFCIEPIILHVNYTIQDMKNRELLPVRDEC